MYEDINTQAIVQQNPQKNQNLSQVWVGLVVVFCVKYMLVFYALITYIVRLHL